MPHVDLNTITSISLCVGGFIWSLIGGFNGGRGIVRWIVGRYEATEKRKQQVSDEISKQARSQVNRRYKEADDALSVLRAQNKELWDQNEQLLKMVQSLTGDVKSVRDLVAGVKNNVNDVKFSNELLLERDHNAL